MGPVERDTGIATVQTAVTLGMNFIDTADYYENAPAYENGRRTSRAAASETSSGWR